MTGVSNSEARRDGATDREIVEAVCIRIEQGELLKDILTGDDSIHLTTFWRMLDRDNALDAIYSRARVRQMHLWADDIVKISDDISRDYIEVERDNGQTYTKVDTEHINRSRLRVDTRKFLMAKIAGKYYGERVQVDHTGEVVTQSLDASELARRVAGMLGNGKREGLTIDQLPVGELPAESVTRSDQDA